MCCHVTYMCADRNLYVHPRFHTHCISLQTCKCLYASMYTHAHANAHAHTWICHVYMHVCICAHVRCIMCMYVHKHRCTHAPVHVYIYIYAWVCVRVCVYACMCWWVSVRVFVRIYICICMNERTNAFMFVKPAYSVLYTCELVYTYAPIMSIMSFIHDQNSSFASDNVYHVIYSWTK